MLEQITTAAIVIIGNEILSGKVKDENSYYLCRELRDLGVEVRSVVTIPDDTETYVHRIGRTGRAGRTGHAITLVTSSQRYRHRAAAGGSG